MYCGGRLYPVAAAVLLEVEAVLAEEEGACAALTMHAEQANTIPANKPIDVLFVVIGFPRCATSKDVNLERQFYRAILSDGDIRSQADFVGVRGVFQVGVGFAAVQNAIHQVLNLVLERVVRYVAAIR